MMDHGDMANTWTWFTQIVSASTIFHGFPNKKHGIMIMIDYD